MSKSAEMVKRIFFVLLLLGIASLACSNGGLGVSPANEDSTGLKCTSLTISTISGQFRTVQSAADWAMLMSGCEIRNWEVNYTLGVATSVSFDKCCR